MLLKGAIVGVLLAAASAAQAQGSGPFAPLAGTWTGSGSITMSNGATERLRCRVSYDVGQNGNTMRQSVRCASDSYRLDLSGDTRHAGGSISGAWSETTRGVGGRLSGTANGDEIRMRVDASNFAANVVVATRGSQQSISIRSGGADIREVSISLRKSGR